MSDLWHALGLQFSHAASTIDVHPCIITSVNSFLAFLAFAACANISKAKSSSMASNGFPPFVQTSYNVGMEMCDVEQES